MPVEIRNIFSLNLFKVLSIMEKYLFKEIIIRKSPTKISIFIFFLPITNKDKTISGIVIRMSFL